MTEVRAVADSEQGAQSSSGGNERTVMATSPGALQLRQLQTMVEISAEKNSTIIFPVPIDWLTAFFGERAPAPPPPETPGR